MRIDLVWSVFFFVAATAFIFVSLKSTEYADDHRLTRPWWWVPALAFIGLAFWCVYHALNFLAPFDRAIMRSDVGEHISTVWPWCLSDESASPMTKIISWRGAEISADSGGPLDHLLIKQRLAGIGLLIAASASSICGVCLLVFGFRGRYGFWSNGGGVLLVVVAALLTWFGMAMLMPAAPASITYLNVRPVDSNIFQISNYSSRASGGESDGSNPDIGPNCPNLMPPIIALIGFIVCIAGIPVLIRGNTPFIIIPSVWCIIFGSAVFSVWLIFWLFPPQHCYAHTRESNYKIIDVTFSEHVSASLGIDASATTYRRTEYVGIVPVVVPEFEFRNVQRQVFAADLVDA